jgi:hypothetical protein
VRRGPARRVPAWPRSSRHPVLRGCGGARCGRRSTRSPRDSPWDVADPAIRAILAEIGASAGAAYADAARWTIHRARSTTSGGLVALVGPPSGPILSIRTAPSDAGRHALGRRSVRFRSSPRSGCRMPSGGSCPMSVATGSVGSVGYLAQRALPGRRSTREEARPTRERSCLRRPPTRSGRSTPRRPRPARPTRTTSNAGSIGGWASSSS